MLIIKFNIYRLTICFSKDIFIFFHFIFEKMKWITFLKMDNFSLFKLNISKGEVSDRTSLKGVLRKIKSCFVTYS